MPPVGFETTISAGERPLTYALDRAATGTGDVLTLVSCGSNHTVLRNFVICCIICRVLWRSSLCGGAVLCYGAVCCMLYSLMYVVVKFCVTVQFVVLSDAVVCVLWCGFVLRCSLLHYLMQFVVCCTV